MLPPIDHKNDIEKFNAFNESKDVVFPDCLHKDIEFNKEKHELRCKCGVAFSGPRLHELERLLKFGNSSGIDKNLEEVI